MTTPDRLRPDQKVRIETYNTDGNLVADNVYSGYNTIQEAINAAAAASTPEGTSPEDYAYTVTDLDTGTSARYRLNAHGHARLIV